MWHLESISATNLCAFKELEYSPRRGCTTLVFGNNMDDDSQKSNGSGKSALIEAISIGLTGEPLRAVKMEEMINDAEDEASITLSLSNGSLGEEMSVSRVISRKSAQSITVLRGMAGMATAVAQASVSDYNKYILDAIGLRKEDLFSCFILSEDKYISFLSSSDRDKKELINRFSNGDLVDKSIGVLHGDIESVEAKLRDSETKVAVTNGRIETLSEQIKTATDDRVAASERRAFRIAEWKETIAKKRAEIRSFEEEARNVSATIKERSVVKDSIAAAATFSKDAQDCFDSLCALFENGASAFSRDYAKDIREIHESSVSHSARCSEFEERLAKQNKAIASLNEKSKKLHGRSEKFAAEYGVKYNKVTEKINNLLSAIKSLDEENKKLSSQRSSLVRDIADIEKRLAGVIRCPSCGHEFTLADNIDIDDERRRLQDRKGELGDIDNTISKNNEGIAGHTEEGREARGKQNALIAEKAKMDADVISMSAQYEQARADGDRISADLFHVRSQIEFENKRLDQMRENMVSEAGLIYSNEMAALYADERKAKTSIRSAEEAISSYEEAIKEQQKSSENDIIGSLKAGKEEALKELDAALSEKESVERELAALKTQEAVFTSFKTHLANTKIDALGAMTNNFLKSIGSDIRIVFSGYTVLKSGKVRDKISISLERNGVDGGSFNKYSKGEKARVGLANILAMHDLTNANCADGLGLDLLVIDEILDKADESGLSNIFDALNKLKITALVVSHGNIAEGYPYKVVVRKQNGISRIDD